MSTQRVIWTKLPAGGGEIAKLNGMLLHVCGRRGSWAFQVTERTEHAGIVGLRAVAVGDGWPTKNDAKREALQSARQSKELPKTS